MRRRLTRLAILAAAATVVFGGGTALPVDHFAVQLFAHFRAQYLVVALLLMSLLVLLRRPAWALTMLATAILNASYLVPWYAAPPDVPGDRTELTVMVANLLLTNREHDRAIALVQDTQPDLVLFQEVTPDWLVALDALRADYPWSYGEARDGSFGLALFSRVPLASVSHVDVAPRGFPTIVARLYVGETLVSFVGTHPTIPVTPGTYAARNAQFDSVAELVATLPGEVVLAGDFNASPWDRRFRDFAAQTGLGNTRLGHGLLPTWPTWLPVAMIPIDHVLVSSDISVAGIRTGPRFGSDHLPLIVTLAL